MNRAIIAWRILGEDLVGTYHMPPVAQACGDIATQHIGVLLINAGSAPRAGNSDLYVHIGDRLAARGIPVFRFDLPGLGDSSGASPPDVYLFAKEVLGGRNDAATLELVRRLKQQFGISNMVIGGLCASAIPSLRAANSDYGEIVGVILMEPMLRKNWDVIPNNAQQGKVISQSLKIREKLGKALSIRDWSVFLTGKSRIAIMLRPIRPILVNVQKLLFGHALPKDMNVSLFMDWRGCLRRGVHSFVVVAEGQGNERYVAQAMESMPTNQSGKISLISIPQTNHILTGGNARDIVLGAVEHWIVNQFP
jgi:pimeloyl-ACP methyl ester carboxylesterase